MTTDLSRTRLERGEVVRVDRFGALVELTAMLPYLAATAEPGQFAQLRCGPGVVPLLRRPFSVAWVDGALCTFVFEEVGAGTRVLGRLRPGDELEVLGPLGHGFTVDAVEDGCVIVSGGVGCAPFPLLIGRLLDRGVRDIVVLSGGSTAERLFPAARFRRGAAIEVREATDDGSRGTRGLVTELLREVQPGERGAIYACGPNRMLAAVAGAVARAGITGRVAEASLEAPMGCGFG
ncbi:MAG: dihydroorotate dehydrogenase electron transfer subunit, partial [Candidatus Dormibacteraeota bacterium]|nr:dihydroorotate dehydrogenase electron transfer subunit [Candidatus Dormibacteraeota bacterium]